MNEYLITYITTNGKEKSITTTEFSFSGAESWFIRHWSEIGNIKSIEKLK